MAVSAENPILVVGAGPTGMMVAIELARRGVPCRIVDRKDQPAASSRAFTIHARTMEVFEMQGTLPAFAASCTPSRGFRFNFDGIEETPVIDFGGLRSRYPYVAMTTQHDIERVLRAHLTEQLGVPIEWNHELASFAQTDDGAITGTLRDRASQAEEHVTPPFVVAADGIHSVVRKSIGLPFEGEAYENMIMQMMDTHVDVPDRAPEYVEYYMKEKSFLLTAALPDGSWRVLISDQGETARHTGTRAEAFQAVVDGFGVNLKIVEPIWATQWVIWKRLAEIYARGNVYLAGDSAHVHSPTAGQGMNSCIQDGWNLGWKLALVAQGEAPRALLDTYQRERLPIGKQLIAGTDALHSIMMAHGVDVHERLTLTQVPGWQRTTAELIGGLSYTYRDDIDVEPDLAPLEDGPLPGDRAPDLDLPGGRTLYGALSSGAHLLLLISDDGTMGQAEAIAREYGDRPGRLIESEIVSGAVPGLAEVYGNDANGSFYLIRPDGYIGTRAGFGETRALDGYIARTFARPH